MRILKQMRHITLNKSSFLAWLMLGSIGALIAGCGGGGDGRDPILGDRGNVGPAPVPPTVTMVAPADNATAVAFNNTLITAQFSEAVDAVTPGNFTLTCAAPCSNASGTVSMNGAGTVATFTPTNPAALDPSTLYTATLVSAVSSASGLALQAPFSWQFTTAALPPTVTAVVPANNATAVAFNNTLITAQFSEAVDAVTPGNFTLTCAAPCSNASGTVSMNGAGTVATFTPANPAALDPSTLYTATLVSAVSSASGLALQAPFSWQFTTAALPPTVTAVAPVNNATGVAVNNTLITAQFSQAVDALVPADFTVTCELPCVDATGLVNMNAASTVATFSVTAPATLTPSTLYTATILTAVSSTSGLALQTPFVWQFTTGLTPDTTRPRVILTEPLTTTPGPTLAVPANTAITAIFSENLNPTTLTDTSFTLTCDFPCVSPTGEVSYIVGSRTGIFTPDAELEAGTTYTATISSSVTDLAGNQLAGNQAPITSASDYVWSFTTEVAVIPENISVLSTFPIDGGTVASCPLVGISATFDVPSGLRLDPNTANSLTFAVVEDANPLNVVVAESVVLDLNTGTIITFTPLAALSEGVTYRVTVMGGSSGVKDLAVPGNEMLLDEEWTFTVVAPANPCVNSVPLNAATPFGGFGGSAGVTNDGLLTIINGDIGTTGASTLVTGFVSASGCEYTVTPLNEGQINGMIYTAPPAPTTPPTGECLGEGTAVTEQIAISARSDANDAFISISPAALPGGATVNQNLGGQTLAPGVYFTPTSYLIEGGDLTLDGQGNQNSVWVFQMGSTLSVGEAAVPRSVVLINGAQPKNVFWQVSSFATINPSGGGTMVGTIIAEAGVSFSTTGNNAPNLVVTLEGRAISLTASVTITNTIINVPAL